MVSNQTTMKRKSLVIFLSFVKKFIDGRVDPSGIISKECYETWLSSRIRMPKNAPESFRKALTSHCCGIDGRKPFPPDVERPLLSLLRQKQVWPCFHGTSEKIGYRGFQARGYWEKGGNDDLGKKRKRPADSTPHMKSEPALTFPWDAEEPMKKIKQIPRYQKSFDILRRFSMQLDPNFKFVDYEFQNQFFEFNPSGLMDPPTMSNALQVPSDLAMNLWCNEFDTGAEMTGSVPGSPQSYDFIEDLLSEF